MTKSYTESNYAMKFIRNKLDYKHDLVKGTIDSQNSQMVLFGKNFNSDH